ncbi:MAG: glycosyltransferase family 9 protein [Desulfarculaceae bacterium]|jgi:ADP-heptose:LPS heptosyltransferase
MRILAVQTLAMGDLLMITPLLAGLKAAHDQAQIQVLANQAFARVLSGNPCLSGMIGFPYREIYTKANLEEAEAVPQTLSALARFCQTLQAGYDLVYNPCFNDPCGALSFLSQGQRVLGVDLTRDGALVMRGDWPAYWHTIFEGPAFNSLHEADLHCLAAGVPTGKGLQFLLSSEEQASAREMLSIGQDKPLVAIHPGAGRQERRWPVEGFIQVGRWLLEQGFQPVLIGIGPDQELTAAINQGLESRALDLAGRTGMGELAGVLAQCRALIANDSGPIHIASALGTPVLSISLGKTQFRATGPYRPASLALEADLDCAPCRDSSECSHQKCKQAITPQDVWAGFQHLMGHEFVRPDDSGARFFQARMAGDGLLDWQALHPISGQEVYTAFRRAWLAMLKPGEGPPQPSQAAMELPQPGEGPLSEIAQACAQALGLLQRLGEIFQGSGDISQAQGLARELSALTQRIAGWGVEDSLAKPLAIYLSGRLAGLDDPAPLTQIKLQMGLFRQVKDLACMVAASL